MKILGIESAAMTASAAVVEDGVVLAEFTLCNKKTHSQTLLPMIDEIAKLGELDLSEVDAIAISAGPGSFTGLRIGSATAKGLGLAWKKPLIPVSTLKAMAYQFYGTDRYICASMDARRQTVFTCICRFNEADELETVLEPCALSAEELIGKMNALGGTFVLTGDGVNVIQKFKDEIAVKYSLAPAHLSRQRAAAVAALGEKRFAAGIFQTAAEHSPEYLKTSQAEREREAKGHA